MQDSNYSVSFSSICNEKYRFLSSWRQLPEINSPICLEQVHSRMGRCCSGLWALSCTWLMLQPFRAAGQTVLSITHSWEMWANKAVMWGIWVNCNFAWADRDSNEVVMAQASTAGNGPGCAVCSDDPQPWRWRGRTADATGVGLNVLKLHTSAVRVSGAFGERMFNLKRSWVFFNLRTWISLLKC